MIVLVITIILVVILAVAVILSIANNNPIDNAKEATQRNNDAALLEQANVIYSYWYQEHQLGKTTTPDDAEEYVRLKLQEQGFDKYDYVHINDGKIASVLYKELEYIESTGKQYIDTEILPTSNKLQINAIMQQTINEYVNFFGSVSENRRGIRLFNNTKTNGIVQAQCGGDSFSVSLPDVLDVLTIQVSINKGSTSQIVINGSSAQITRNDTTNNSSILLCASNVNRGVNGIGSFKVWSFEIIKDEIQLFKGIPCITSSNEVGLYNIVNDKFYGNAGTGEFISGNEI